MEEFIVPRLLHGQSQELLGPQSKSQCKSHSFSHSHSCSQEQSASNRELVNEGIKLSDSALVPFGDSRLAMTADSFVVKPLSFPGGSIGSLSVNGTLNDLAVSGAKPLALMCTLILEAGTALDVLDRELTAMAKAASLAGVSIVGGDTKVVEHGKADGLYITTFGIGQPQDNVCIDPTSLQAGDRILLSGPIGDHGITILLARGELDIEADLQSDSRSVWPMVEALLKSCGNEVRWMRDPTRGGVATALNELAQDSGMSISIEDALVPVRDTVRGACEVLGLDVLHVANEGQFLAAVSESACDLALAALRAVEGGDEACVIGEIKESPAGKLTAVTPYGSSRIVDMLVGDQLPRIC